MHMQFLQFSANQFSAENKKIKVPHFEIIQSLKLVEKRIDEEMQPPSLKKNSVLI